MSAATSDRSAEVLVWAPRGRDSALTTQLIARHGMSSTEINHMDELAAAVPEVGCAVVAAEALTGPVREVLMQALSEQPPWSDFPIVLIAPRGVDRTDDALAAVNALGNVAILERPVNPAALISAVVAALRGRRRQYDAREAIHRRDQFLAMLGHELRNPLASISLAVGMLPRSQSESPGDKQRAIIERQARHLTRLVDDLLDVARVTSGKVRLRVEPLDLNEVVRRCVQGAELAADSRGIELRCELSSRSLAMDGDLVRLEEIFNNLLANAVKYSKAGASVTVTTRAAKNRGVVEIEDAGIGIAPDMIVRIFDLFAQAETALDRSHGGLGIGLTLVRSLVELHHGTIRARSPGLGQGSTFTVDLPLSRTAPRAESHPHVAAIEAPPSLRVLLIEDNPDLLEVTKDQLELYGHQVRAASDGAEGLAALVEAPPDVAFIDIGLPTLDGYAIASEARAQGVTSVLVAMTGYGQPDDLQRAMAAGFDRHVTKPVTSAILRSILAAAITPGPPRDARVSS